MIIPFPAIYMYFLPNDFQVRCSSHNNSFTSSADIDRNNVNALTLRDHIFLIATDVPSEHYFLYYC